MSRQYRRAAPSSVRIGKAAQQPLHATAQSASPTQHASALISTAGGSLLCCEGLAYLGLAAHEEVERRVEVLAAMLCQRVHIQLVLSSVERTGNGASQPHRGSPLITTHPPREVIHEAALCAHTNQVQVLYPDGPPATPLIDGHRLLGLMQGWGQKAILLMSYGAAFVLWHSQSSGLEDWSTRVFCRVEYDEVVVQYQQSDDSKYSCTDAS